MKLTPEEKAQIEKQREAKRAAEEDTKAAFELLAGLSGRAALAIADSVRRRQLYDDHRTLCPWCDNEDLCGAGQRIFDKWIRNRTQYA
jgi:hypothetical protein